MRLAPLGADAEALQHRLDILGLGLALGMAISRTCRITSASMHLLQRRPEGRDQLVRQIGDEAHGVRQDRLAAARAGAGAAWSGPAWRTACPWPHLRLGQPVEQRGLAGIGVADQRHHRIRHPLPAPAAAAPRVRRTSSSSRFDPRNALLRCSRRSVSIWVSPGPPRKPKPPRWRSRWVQVRTSRDSRRRAAPAPPAGAPSRVRARGGRRSPGSGRCGRSPWPSRPAPGCAAGTGDRARRHTISPPPVSSDQAPQLRHLALAE